MLSQVHDLYLCIGLSPDLQRTSGESRLLLSLELWKHPFLAPTNINRSSYLSIGTGLRSLPLWSLGKLLLLVHVAPDSLLLCCLNSCK